MLEIDVVGHVTRRVHSSRAEQEDGLPEQRCTHRSHVECATGVLQQCHHVADGLCDFVGVRDRRRSRPGVLGVLGSGPLDECPEGHQYRVLFGLASDERGTVAKQTREVEISTRNTIEPVADSLT